MDHKNDENCNTICVGYIQYNRCEQSNSRETRFQYIQILVQDPYQCRIDSIFSL